MIRKFVKSIGDDEVTFEVVAVNPVTKEMRYRDTRMGSSEPLQRISRADFNRHVLSGEYRVTVDR